MRGSYVKPDAAMYVDAKVYSGLSAGQRVQKFESTHRAHQEPCIKFRCSEFL